MKATHLIFAAVLFASAGASAHEAKGPHGGALTDAGSWHVELVATDQQVDLYISDGAAKPVAATGFKGVAILMIGGKAQRIPLAPLDETRLRGTAPASLPRAPKGAVQLTAPDGKTANAKFN